MGAEGVEINPSVPFCERMFSKTRYFDSNKDPLRQEYALNLRLIQDTLIG